MMGANRRYRLLVVAVALRTQLCTVPSPDHAAPRSCADRCCRFRGCIAAFTRKSGTLGETADHFRLLTRKSLGGSLCGEALLQKLGSMWGVVSPELLFSLWPCFGRLSTFALLSAPKMLMMAPVWQVG